MFEFKFCPWLKYLYDLPLILEHFCEKLRKFRKVEFYFYGKVAGFLALNKVVDLAAGVLNFVIFQFYYYFSSFEAVRQLDWVGPSVFSNRNREIGHFPGLHHNKIKTASTSGRTFDVCFFYVRSSNSKLANNNFKNPFFQGFLETSLIMNRIFISIVSWNRNNKRLRLKFLCR